MERRGKMDAAGRAPGRKSLIRAALAFLSFLILLATPAWGQSASNPEPQAEAARKLIAEERWQEAATLVESSPQRSPDLDFYYGTALAHLERWDDARAAFLAGFQLRPGEERFPLELAGVEFKQKRYPTAARYLRSALALSPDDAYASDFLATVYFLEGNLEAALKYWNRVDKPRIAAVQLDPVPRVKPVLLDHAQAFAPASQLRLPDFLTSEARVRGLEIFSSFNYALSARDDGRFDVTFNNQERNGFGNNKWDTLLEMFRYLPAQTITPEYLNFRRQAINLISMYRFDAQKRRAEGEVSAPWGGPRRRVFFGGDWRDENWDIRSTWVGNVPLLGGFSLGREAASAGVRFFPSGRWNWSAGAEFSHRDFRNVFSGSVLTPQLLSQGDQLKQVAEANADLWRSPERRIAISGGLSSQLGRIWSSPAHTFEKLQAVTHFDWLPQAEGDDYEMQEQLRAGKTWGTLPIDELFTLGVLGDNNLHMRGHITTHDGRKGSGPLGRNYFLSNWEMDKNVFHDGLVAVKLGPFVDTGKITDPSPGLGSQKWLCDTGAQLKVQALGLGVAIAYGRDLRSGHGALSVTILGK